MTTVQHLVAQLFDRYASGTSKDNLFAEMRSGLYGDPIPCLAQYLADSDEYISTYALDAMFRLDPVRATEYALPLLPNPDWQFAICYLITKCGGAEQVVEPLTEVLLSAEDADTRFMAAHALEQIGNARALPALKHARDYDQGCDHDGCSVSEAAAEAISTITSRLKDTSSCA